MGYKSVQKKVQKGCNQAIKREGIMREWIKLYVSDCLYGTIRFDFDPAERGIWYDLLLLAGAGKTDGVVGAAKDKPYPRSYIANLLNIPEELLDRVVGKCIQTGRIEEKGGLRIVNWSKYQPKYQSDYQRQKPYREAKRDRERELEAEGRCPKCGEKGHTKYKCPKGKYSHVVQS